MNKGWPNTHRLGEPRRPEESGPHWINRGHGAEILYWDADEACWPTDARDMTLDLAEHYWSYISPVTLPWEDTAKDQRIAELVMLVKEKLDKLQAKHDSKGHDDRRGDPDPSPERKLSELHQEHCWMVRASNLLSWYHDHAGTDT